MIITLFEEIALEYAKEAAVKSPTLTLTYDQLNRFANRLARTLRTVDCKKRGEQLKAAILLDHGALQPAALMGVLKAGDLYVPMDPFYPIQRLRYMVENSEVSVILTDAANLKMANEMVKQLTPAITVLNIDEPLEATDSSNLNLKHPGDRFAYILYTSGSTGRPKGVVQTLDNVLYYTRNWIERFNITESDRMTFLTSFCHDGAVQDIFSALLSGAALCPLDVKRIDIVSRMAGWLLDNSVTIWHSVPTLFRYFSEGLEREAHDFEDLRYILLGGEPLRDRDISLTKTLFPNAILANIYGQTESSVNSIFQIRPDDVPAKPVIGEPLSDTEILLVDDEGDIVEDMGVGEIVVACPHLAHGYWMDEELTEEKFDEDEDLGRLYWTGDLGARLGAGDIEMMGRRDLQVKIRGFRVETGDIESALLEHPLVKDAAVKAIVPESGENLLCAYWVVEDLGESTNEADLRQFLLGRLPDYMVPSRFIPLPEMPLTPNGKVDRKRLPEVVDAASDLQFIAPRNYIERALAVIWAKVLGISTGVIGIDHDFFQLGGHSLKAVTLSLKIQQELEVKIELPVIFSHTTIRRQGEFIQQASKKEFQRITAAPKMDYYPASSQQQRLYFLYTMNPESIAYNLPQIIQLRGIINKEKIEQVFQRLVTRHEALRTFFSLLGGELRQIIQRPVGFHLETISLEGKVTVEEISGSFIRPFDLSKPPLLRVGLASQSDDRALLMVDIHHIIADGSSLAILIREFIALFGGQSLPEPRLHYKDYACWMREPEQVELLDIQKRYWLSVYDDEPPLLDLPLDMPRPPVHSFEGERIIFSFDCDLTQRLESKAAAIGCTLYVLLAAIYSVFLAKVSGQEDVIIGTPVSGRNHADLHQLLGMFVNTLALRLQPEGTRSFSSYVQAVKTHVLEAMNHQIYPFEELVESLNLAHDVSRNPLFDTMFMLQTFMDQEYDIPEVTIGGLEASPVDYRSQRSLFDLSLQGGKTAESLSFTLEYSAALFKQTTIQRFIGFFTKIAQQILDDPDVLIHQISILPEEDKQLLIQSFNSTEQELPKGLTILGLILKQGETSPNKMAVVDSHRQITFGTLLDEARSTASSLQAAGAGKETIVAVMLGQSLDMVVGILGILLSGAAYLPLSADEPMARLRFKLKDAAVRLALGQRSLLEGDLPDIQILDLEEANPGGCEPVLPVHLPAPEGLAYVIYTSGSTGFPKGVMVEHRNLFNAVSWYVNDTGLTSEDRLLLMTSFTFDASIDQLFASLAIGGILDIVTKTAMADPEALRHMIRSHRVTVLTFVPGFLRRLLSGDMEASSVKLVVCGGEPLTDSTKDFFLSRGFRVRNHYGPTETTITALATECATGEVTLGKPVQNARCYIIDRNNRQLPIGIYGEMAIGGAGVSRGYLNRPELQAERFVSIPDVEGGTLYKTGDTGRVTSDLDVEFRGRKDNQIKFRGYRLELTEIEHAIMAFPEVANAAVLLDKGDDGNPMIRSFLAPEEAGVSDSSGKRLIERLRERLIAVLPDCMVPSRFDILDALPLTANGKVDRAALQARKAEQEAFIPPTTPLEHTIAGLFASALDQEVEMIPRNRGFFQLGGNSLAVIRLKIEISKELAVDVPALQLFKTPTVQGLASFVAGMDAEVGNHPAMALLNPEGQCPIFCFPPFTGLGLSYFELARHIQNYSVYAFDFLEPEGRIARYADAIQAMQPREPLVLMGYSVGGILALHVVAELERQGREVAALALLDCFLPGDIAFGENNHNKEEQLMEMMKTSLKELDLDLQLEEALRRARKYLGYFREATLPPPVNADLYLLGCGESDHLRRDRGWSSTSKGKTQIIQAKGDHYKMLSGGFARENARLIQRLLQKMSAQ